MAWGDKFCDTRRSSNLGVLLLLGKRYSQESENEIKEREDLKKSWERGIRSSRESVLLFNKRKREIATRGFFRSSQKQDKKNLKFLQVANTDPYYTEKYHIDFLCSILLSWRITLHWFFPRLGFSRVNNHVNCAIGFSFVLLCKLFG